MDIENEYFKKIQNQKIMSYYIDLDENAEIDKNFPTDNLLALNDMSVIYIYCNKTQYYIGQTNSLIRRHEEHLREKEDSKLTYKENFGNGTLVVFYGDKISSNLNYIEMSLIKIFKEFSTLGKIKILNSPVGNRSDLFQIKREMVDSEVVKLILQSLVNNNKLREDFHFNLTSLKAILYRDSPFFELDTNQKKISNRIINPKSQYDIFIVRGAAGTGKTVLLNTTIAKLLGKNIQLHKEKNTMLKIGVCFKTNLKKHIQRIFKSIEKDYENYELQIGTWKNLIDIYNAKNDENKYDYIFVDEAQRLLKKSKNIFPIGYRKFIENSGEEDVLSWLTKISKKIILFYDENQTIRPTDINDIGNKNAYSTNYTFLNKKIIDKKLNSQHRIKITKDGKSNVQVANSYVEYIKYMLGIEKDNKPTKLDFLNLDFLDYDYFSLCNDIKEIKLYVKEKNQQFPYKKARVLAGFTRPYHKRGKGIKPKPEFKEIGMFWNHDYKNWAISDKTEKEVGAIHSAQGYDFDFIGLIIGRDLEYKNGRVVVNKKNYKDINGKKGMKDHPDLLEKYIKNVYYTLLTRGIYGTKVYIEDDALREYWIKETEELKQNRAKIHKDKTTLSYR